MDNSSTNQAPPHDDRRYELFVRLLLEHEPQIRSFLRVLLPSWQDVEEVTQETSLVAWRKFAGFEEGTSFGGWFLTIARFEALKYRRRVARSPLVLSDQVWDMLAEEAEEGAQADSQQLRRQHLEACLDKLDEGKRDLLLKVYSPGVVMREVAKQSEKGEQAFYKVIQRLRAFLLDCVSKAIAVEGT